MIDDQLTRFERLTDKQRECLQLVVQRKSSKQIARILDISKPAVDQRITNARRILGAENRDEAAIMFANLSNTYDSITYDPECVPPTISLAQGLEREASSSSGLTLNSAIAPYGFGIEQEPEWRNRFLEWLSGNERATRRLAIIFAFGAGTMAIVLVGLAIAQTLSELLAAS